MNKNRFLLVLVIAALTLATVSFAVAPKASQPYPDYAQRHAGEVLIPCTRSERKHRLLPTASGVNCLGGDLPRPYGLLFPSDLDPMDSRSRTS